MTGSGPSETTFRVQGREPELWDPTTGRIRAAVWYRTTDDKRTTVPLQFPKNGSVFVVFRKPAQPQRLAAVAAPEGSLEIVGCSANGVLI